LLDEPLNMFIETEGWNVNAVRNIAAIVVCVSHVYNGVVYEGLPSTLNDVSELLIM